MKNQTLDIKDAAELCGLTPWRISELLCKRLFPRPTIVNSKPQFWRDECEQWRAENVASKPAQPVRSYSAPRRKAVA